MEQVQAGISDVFSSRGPHVVTPQGVPELACGGPLFVLFCFVFVWVFCFVLFRVALFWLFMKWPSAVCLLLSFSSLSLYIYIYIERSITVFEKVYTHIFICILGSTSGWRGRRVRLLVRSWLGPLATY